MSAYNGANYIRTQIDSLLSQTYKDFEVYIRVDGSADGTTEIVDEYANRFPDKIKHVDINGENLGCGQSFMWLLEHTEADYYMYCDQDDVWLKQKVELSFEQMKRQETACQGKPVIVYTDLYVTDAALNITNGSFWQEICLHPEFFSNFNAENFFAV